MSGQRLPATLLLVVLLSAGMPVCGQSAPAHAATSALPAAADRGADAVTAMPGMSAHPHAAGPTVPATQHAADMPGMEPATRPMPTMAEPAPAASVPSAAHAGMAGMDEAPAEHASMSGMAMPAMQGGRAPTDARSPDYSDGIGYGAIPGMDMADDAAVGMLRFDQFEQYHGRDGSGQAWEVQGWYGDDADKLRLRSEGERSAGRIEDGDAEVLWSHAVAAYWDTTLGMRHDFGRGPARDWLAVGVQGLAPYWFELEATAYLGPSGRSAARLRADYELLFTQRLVLQPELEANLFGRDDPTREVGRGLSDARFALRLRYEIRRELAPYVGVVLVRRFGHSADFAHARGTSVLDRQFVAGLRFWF